MNEGFFDPYLTQGISCASVEYRLLSVETLPTPVHDAVRAVQFLRHKADELNIRKDRVALTGGGAGACTSMYILLHEDLADLESTDPVKRESSRVTAAAVRQGQTSIDPTVAPEWIGPNLLKHKMLFGSVGEPDAGRAVENYEKHRSLFVEFSPINHVTADDPPLLMTYVADMTLPAKNASHAIHHGMYGVKLKEKSDSVGHECHLLIPGTSTSQGYQGVEDFLIEKLLEK
ncbi:alpha/beta hydrolase fold domain-containing protein [Planctomicrobium sp. SH668]|uniref:alpha/beta hydrolase fold domain-containing protein n=1 Tax=Planctomicrobium sp. SH668 TaxID=3448126 RepID=UPI003F5C1D7A